MKFGDVLKKLREEKQLTQQELADIFNLSKSNISKYENNILEPNLSSLSEFADFFGVSMNFLLGKPEKEPEKTTEPILSKKHINEIDPDLRAIQRAREKMTPEQKDKMMKVLNAAFDDFFEDK